MHLLDEGWGHYIRGTEEKVSRKLGRSCGRWSEWRIWYDRYNAIVMGRRAGRWWWW